VCSSQKRHHSIPEIALVNSRYSRQKSLTTFAERDRRKIAKKR
jgi:hypothetical protein